MDLFLFVPFKSFVHPSFWHRLAVKKLDIDRLNDSAKRIYGFYTNSDTISDCLMDVDCTGFNETWTPNNCQFPCHGTLYNKNTKEEFINCDKVEMLQVESERIWQQTITGDFLTDSSQLSRFILLSFADLKRHNYYYWFAFPIINLPFYTVGSAELVTSLFTRQQFERLQMEYFNGTVNKSFFIIEMDLDDSLIVRDVSDVIKHKCPTNFHDKDFNRIYFCFSDPSPNEMAGWPCRQFLVYLSQQCPLILGKTINLLALRVRKNVSLESSIQFRISMPNESDLSSDKIKWLGWEKNDSNKMTPRIAKMASTMDPKSLAESSINLNLKLMKWRLLPELNLSKLTTTKCLLIGAGTLGCSIARNLLAWGIKHITLIDYGNVSLSNPVRQNLYRYEDSIGDGKLKAVTAAERLLEINPNLTVTGYNLHVPMPGHTVGESMLEKTIETLDQLGKLIEEHDCLFLLTDSRESRWLPTLLGAHFGKIVINAALGFDSYLVMRHGNRSKSESDGNRLDPVILQGLKSISGNRLGCYFCNDITAPGNSMRDRTLDQQCTVTRPGVSSIASALAVELLISILQHPDGHSAPAYLSTRSNDQLLVESEQNGTVPEGILGIIPHSIRGYLGTFEQILPATEQFNQCIACSEIVLTEYRNRGNEFILKVLESSKYLEDLTGVSKIYDLPDDVIEFSESESMEDFMD